MSKVKLYLKTDTDLTANRKKARIFDRSDAERLARDWTGGGILATVENVLPAGEIEAAGLALHGVPQSYLVRIADEYPPA